MRRRDGFFVRISRASGVNSVARMASMKRVDISVARSAVMGPFTPMMDPNAEIGSAERAFW